MTRLLFVVLLLALALPAFADWQSGQTLAITSVTPTATPGADSAPLSLNTGKLAMGWFPTGTTALTLTIGNDARLNPTPAAAASAFRLVFDTNGAYAAMASSSAAFQVPWVNSGQTAVAWGLLTTSNLSPTAGIVGGQIADGTITATNLSATAGITTTHLSATAGILGTQMADNTLTVTQMSATYVDGAADAASMRTLGTGAQQACGGADSRLPTAGEKEALAGTTGSPTTTNKYVTDSDPRLSTTRAGDVLLTSGESVMRIDFATAMPATTYSVILSPVTATTTPSAQLSMDRETTGVTVTFAGAATENVTFSYVGVTH